jgi:hypothetical protein
MLNLLPLFVLAAATLVQQQSPSTPNQPDSASARPSEVSSPQSGSPARIQWFGTLEQGLAEAKRTNRPLLMTAAAPMCRDIAGMW